MPQIFLFFLPALMAFAITFFLGRLLCAPSLASYFIDATGGKKLHRNPVANSGGIALFLGILIPVLIFEGEYILSKHLYLLLGLTAMFALGLVDDLKPLGWFSKLLIQLLIITFVVIMADLRLQSVLLEHHFYQIPYYLSTVVSILILAFLTNAFNFIDGIDGLATTVALLFILGLLYFQTPFSSVFLMSIGAALFGFRRLNKEPGALFMGDSGSLSIGFICAFLLLIFIDADLTIANTRLSSYQQRLPIAITLFWYPIFDTIRVLIIRITNGKSLFKRDKRHSYSVLLRLGYSHTQIVGSVASLTLLQVAACYFLEPILGLVSFFVLLFLVWLALHFYLGFLIKRFKTGNLN